MQKSKKFRISFTVELTPAQQEALVEYGKDRGLDAVCPTNKDIITRLLVERGTDVLMTDEVIRRCWEDVPGVKQMEAEVNQWAKDNPGAAGRADRVASILLKLKPVDVQVLQHLAEEGPCLASKLRRIKGAARVSLRDLEHLRLMEWDGDEWLITELGIEVVQAHRDKDF